MIETLTTLQAIEVLAESTRDAGNLEQEHKHKKHKKDKKHKDEKSKKHRRDKERKHTKDDLLRDSAGRDGRETQRNGLVANGVAAANVESCRSTKADSEPESGEIPDENRHAEHKLVTAPALDLFAEDCLPPATVHPKEVEGPKRLPVVEKSEKKRKREDEDSSSRDDRKGGNLARRSDQATLQDPRETDAKQPLSADVPRRPSRDVEETQQEDLAKVPAGDSHKQVSASRDDRGRRSRHDVQRHQAAHNSTRTRDDSRRPNDLRRHHSEHEGHRRKERHIGDSPARRHASQDRRNDSRRGDPYVRDLRRDDDRYNGFDRRARNQTQRSYHATSPPRRRDRDVDRVTSERHRSRSRNRMPSRREREELKELNSIVDAAIEGEVEEDEDKLIAERRARRQAILEKHQKQKEQTDAVVAPTASELQSRVAVSDIPAASTSILQSPKPSDEGDSGHCSPGSEVDDELGDIRQDGDLWQSGGGKSAVESGEGAESHGESSEEKHKVENQEKRAPIDIDMFADQPESEVPDIFAGSPGNGPIIPVGQRRLQDNFDDPEGYYNFQVGEVMDNRYEVYATHGKGVFSTVLRARDLAKKNPSTGAPIEVAIKVIRANDIMYKAGQTETVILRKLAGADPEGKRHVVRFIRTFDYRSHLCLVFESMDINLRELTKKYGRGIGLNLRAVHAYAHQLLWALYHLRSCGVLHADIKPDNILVNKGRNIVKLCDFGSAMFAGDNEVTPYLVSRFYRSPEVILGLKYEHAMDMWSIGCVLYELFTGKILFPGKTNNEMLKLMMDVKGPVPKKMLKKAAFADKHFDDDLNMSFALMEEDPVTRRPIRKMIANPTVKHDFAALLAGSEGEKRKIAQFADLLEKMMHLDPEKRITPKDALRHPFIKDQPKSGV